ncbi:MAG TPA: hypothetical protein VGA37_14050 [Gemmatimonadales bacterium]
MNQQLGMAEFFAMEASEYLERLDTLVSATGTPDPEKFQRLTRALRGAALMANQEPIAHAAGALEQLARTIRDGTRQWDVATRQLSTRAVDDLKVFVRQVRNWSDADTAKAEELAAALEAVSGRRSQSMRAPVEGGLDAGTRAFIAREGASVASALDRAATAIAHHPQGQDPLRGVLDVMQPLRGLASLADLPPMPDLLEGIERGIAEALRASTAPAGASETLDAAAKALSQVAREVAADGKAEYESLAVRQFATMLSRLLGFDQAVPSIESLFFDDAGPHIVEPGAARGSAGPIDKVLLVAQGEHLKEVADQLTSAASLTSREFRVHGLAGTIRVLEGLAGSPPGDATARLARALRAAIATGVAVNDCATFCMHLRNASAALASASASSDPEFIGYINDVADDIDAGAPAVPISELAPEEPARSRPAPLPAAAAPTAAAAPRDTGAEPNDLVGTMLRYERLRDTLGPGDPSLDALVAGPVTAPVPAAAAVATPLAAAEQDIVPITDLCYRGAAALRRAMSLRDQLLQAAGSSSDDATELILEVFDLVEISLETT